MTWYRTGTVAVTNNSKAVTGSGTGWSAIATFSLVGSGFRGPDGRIYEIEAVNGGTSLSLVEVYLGATASGQAYAIQPTLGLAGDLAVAVSALIQRTASTFDSSSVLGKGLLSSPDASAALTLLGLSSVLSQSPPGTVAYFAGNPAPAGWLPRNGAAVPRADYPALFAVIGTTYGAGNGSTTFNVPDDRGNFIRGWDASRGVDVGRVLGSEQLDSIKAHQHNNNVAGSAGGSAARFSFVANDGVPFTQTSVTGDVETRPRNRAYLPIIKY